MTSACTSSRPTVTFRQEGGRAARPGLWRRRPPLSIVITPPSRGRPLPSCEQRPEPGHLLPSRLALVVPVGEVPAVLLLSSRVVPLPPGMTCTSNVSGPCAVPRSDPWKDPPPPTSRRIVAALHPQALSRSGDCG